MLRPLTTALFYKYRQKAALENTNETGSSGYVGPSSRRALDLGREQSKPPFLWQPVSELTSVFFRDVVMEPVACSRSGPALQSSCFPSWCQHRGQRLEREGEREGDRKECAVTWSSQHREPCDPPNLPSAIPPPSRPQNNIQDSDSADSH